MTVINLIPAPLLAAQAQRTRLLRWTLAAAVAALLAAIPCLLSLSRTAQIASLKQQLGDVEELTSTLRTQLRSTSARAQELLAELERSRALRSKRSWSGMFALLGSALPDQCWLTSIATDPEAPSAALPPPLAPGLGSRAPNGRETVTIEAPRKLRLTGLSSSDAAPLTLVGSLRESKSFSQVALLKTIRASAPGPETRDPGPGLYQFEILCEW